MKRIFLICCGLIVSAVVFAQEGKVLSLYYFDHERSTPVRKLCAVIDDLFTTGASDANTDYILYLPNGENPFVVPCKEEYRPEYNRFLGELRDNRYHTIFPEDDIKHIVDLFSKYNYLDENGKRLYETVNVVFYIGQDFWLNGYTESLIAKLAFIMDWAKLDVEFFHLDIYRDENDTFDYDGALADMFGTRKLINPVPFIFTY